MSLQRIIRVALCLIILIALGCGQESDILTEDSGTAGMEPSDDGIDKPLGERSSLTIRAWQQANGEAILI